MTRPVLLAALLLASGSLAAYGYDTPDAAAVAFVKMVRAEYPGAATKEYCAWIVKGADGKYGWGAINEGDHDGCKAPATPAGVAAGIHTHPTRAGGADLTAAGQVFSENDFAHSEWKQQPLPEYLGAPAGHVLRYDPGGSECRTMSIRRKFKAVSGISAADLQRLPIVPGVFTPLVDFGGRPIPKPSYCRPAS